MSNDSYYNGSVRIDPPLPWAAIKDSPYLPDIARTIVGGWRDVRLVTTSNTVDTDHSRIVVTTAHAVVPAAGHGALYHLTEHLRDLVGRHPEHQFAGAITRWGEEYGDLSRVEVLGQQVVEVRPVIVWPGDPIGWIGLDPDDPPIGSTEEMTMWSTRGLAEGAAGHNPRARACPVLRPDNLRGPLW